MGLISLYFSAEVSKMKSKSKLSLESSIRLNSTGEADISKYPVVGEILTAEV